MTPPEKKPRLGVDALAELKTYGNLSDLVNRVGHLPNYVKTLIDQITPEDLDEYLRVGYHGQRLFATICLKNNLDDVRYAVETLRLNVHPVLCDPLNECWCCPIALALRAKVPQPAVISYLIEQGCSVNSGAFAMWTLLSVDEADIRGLLEILIRFGRRQMPPTADLLSLASEQHVNVLCEFVQFTMEDMYKAAEKGYTTSVDLMSVFHDAKTTTERDKLADIFELCEVSRYTRSKKIDNLAYFRKSAQFRESPRQALRGPAWRFGERKMFETVEEIDRLQEQIANDEFLETSWQLLLASVRHGHLPDGIIDARFFWRLRNNTLSELAELKSFGLMAGAFPATGPTILRKILREIFLNQFWSHCVSVILDIDSPSVTLLPGIYECFREAHERTRPRWPLVYIRDVISEMDTANLIEDSRVISPWSDECLFMMALLYNSDLIGEAAELIILSLLRRNASLMILPGQKISTLSILLRNTPEVPESIREELATRTCCRMDLEQGQLAMLVSDNSSRFQVSSLRCSASIACKRFKSVILEQSLPVDLVSLVLRHPYRDGSLHDRVQRIVQ